MKNPVQIPYSVGSYEEIVRGNYYFVDKTNYIPKLERFKAPVFLRPRKFGKSLICSILECYYDINRADNFEKLFGATWIGKNPTPEKNSCMVLSFDFSTITVGSDLQEIEKSFSTLTKEVLSSFLAYYAKYFSGKTFDFETERANDVLGAILEYLKNRKLPQLYVIIDEYDNFSNQLIQSQKDNLYGDLTGKDSFFKTFFKVLKSGLGKETIRRVYITGVLPITIDDLTSGFNVAEFLTLKPDFEAMLGFTGEEVDKYLEKVYDDYGFDKESLNEIREIMRKNYDGYLFQLNGTHLYNSTIATYFLKNFVENGGVVPREIIDTNIKADVSWIQRLAQNQENAQELIDKMIFDEELFYDETLISSKFNSHRFFNKNFYPISLFYLGILTFKDDFFMTLPNQTMKTICIEYRQEIGNFSVISEIWAPYFMEFVKTLDFSKLFAAYHEHYLGQFPAQIFDKVNENFIRSTFFDLCRRFLRRNFLFSIETNNPEGRSDFEMSGRPETIYRRQKWLIEFKHFKKETKNILEMAAPLREDIDQIQKYADAILRDFPESKLELHLVYTVGRKYYRFFKLTDGIWKELISKTGKSKKAVKSKS